MKPLSRRALLRASAAGVLAACLGVGRVAVDAPGAAAAASIELLHPWNGDSGGARAMAALARRYKELRPDVDVRQAVVPGSDLELKQIAAFASGRVPDAMLVFAEMLPAYADRGLLAVLDDRMARDGIALGDYADVVAAQSSWAGHVHALTHHPDLRTVLYRSEPLLRAAGLDPAVEPASWAALRDAAAQVTRRAGGDMTLAGWLPAWSEVPWALLFPLANGASLLDAEGAHAAFDAPAVVEALDFAVAATDQTAGGWEPVVAYSHHLPGPGQETALAVGSMAFAVGGNWYLDRLTSPTASDAGRNVQLSLMPGGPSAPWDRVSLAGGALQAIPRAARNADLAWDWLRWVAGPEGQGLIQGNSYDIAGLRTAMRDPGALAGHLFRAALVDTLERTNAPAHLPTPVWPRLRDEIARVQTLLLQKQLSAAQAAAELQARAQATIDSYRATGRTLYGAPPAAAPSAPALAGTGNLLRNPGFEGGSYRAGISSSVANDWSRWFQHRGQDDPGYWLPEPEFGVLAGRAGQMRSGSQAHRWFTLWSVHNGGVYQTVQVPPGAWLRFSAWLFSWSSQADQFGRSDGVQRRWVGIDPDGGTDAFDPRVVWSSADAAMDRWAQLAVVAQARRDRVTVFVRTQPDFAVKHNDVLLDDCELVVVPAPADPNAAALLAAPAVAPAHVDLAGAVAGATDVTTAPVSGSLAGNPAGAHAYAAFDYPGGEALRRIVVQATPDDPAALARFGFRVYGPRMDAVYAMSGLRVGEQPNVAAVLPVGDAGRYLVDLYNYNPTGQVDYLLRLATT